MLSKPLEPVDESVRILSAGLELEGILSYPAEATQLRGAALLCSPHPFLGGDMNGNIIRALRRTLAANGWMTLSFNYRGIGASQTDLDLERFQREFWEKSTCPAYEAKIFVDAPAALGVLKKAAGLDAGIAVAGYSFGCLPALTLAADDPSVSKAALISPPVAKWPLEAKHRRVRAPKTVFWSSGDFACPEETLKKEFAGLQDPKSLVAFGDCGHFYVGREDELAVAVVRALEA